MRNGATGQFRKFVRSALVGSFFGALGGALYGVVWALTHWAVSGRTVALSTSGLCFLGVGMALGLVGGACRMLPSAGAPEGPPDGRRRTTPLVNGRLGARTSSALRRLG